MADAAMPGANSLRQGIGAFRRQRLSDLAVPHKDLEGISRHGNRQIGGPEQGAIQHRAGNCRDASPRLIVMPLGVSTRRSMQCDCGNFRGVPAGV